ncbi:LuxR C-terminal-related transcriptional regulator [Conexibacter sp. W3-3-2]|nr:LuxR C-terminal-related transcriptional regulator [Conexibacter sp. W3-3-2]
MGIAVPAAAGNQGREELRGSFDAAAPVDVTDALARLDALVAHDEAERRAAGEGIEARFDALLRTHRALGRLRDEANTPQALIENAPRAVAEACGFTRVMISRVRGSMWVPEVLHIAEGSDPEGGDAFRSYIEQAEIPLAHMLMETELVRRRMPTIVEDPPTDERTFKAIVDVSRSPSYVAAPILSTRRVIGFFHADAFGQGRALTAEDRDALWLFTENFALLFERAVLVQRLEEQRTRLQEALARAARRIDEMCTEDIDLVRHEPIAAPGAGGARAAATARPATRIDGLLTAREREVLELMASGATNTGVAQRLVISEGTVKSHVKHILRKLRVANRAEAVSRYLHMVHRERRAGL